MAGFSVDPIPGSSIPGAHVYKKILVAVTAVAAVLVVGLVGPQAFAGEKTSALKAWAVTVTGDKAPFMSLVDGSILPEYTFQVTITVRNGRVVHVAGTYLNCGATSCTVNTGRNMFNDAIAGLDPQAVSAVRRGQIDSLAYNGGQGEAADAAIADMYKRSLRSAVDKARARGLLR
jgi:hypothetical protein